MSVNKDMNVLVVDDNKAMLRIIHMHLNEIGFANVDEATNGGAALNKLEEQDYGLVISDWNMKPMTGLDFLKGVRAQGSTVPFIMITSETKTENVLAAREAGVNNYIVKPFNADTLKTKLVSVLGEF